MSQSQAVHYRPVSGICAADLAYKGLAIQFFTHSVAMSHREPRTTEPIKQLMKANVIAHRYHPEKVGSPFLGILTGIRGHLLAFEGYEPLHGSLSGVLLAKVP